MLAGERQRARLVRWPPRLTGTIAQHDLVANPAGRFALTLLDSNYIVDLELSAAQAEGRGEIVSSPRVVTANQREAVI